MSSNNKNVVKGPVNPVIVEEPIIEEEPVLEHAHEEAEPIPEYMYQARVKTLLNLREKPTKDSAVLRLLQQGDIVEVIAVINGWAQLEEGYCMIDFIEQI